MKQISYYTKEERDILQYLVLLTENINTVRKELVPIQHLCCDVNDGIETEVFNILYQGINALKQGTLDTEYLMYKYKQAIGEKKFNALKILN